VPAWTVQGELIHLLRGVTWTTQGECQDFVVNYRVIEHGVMLLTHKRQLPQVTPASLYEGSLTELPCGCPVSTQLFSDSSNGECYLVTIT